MALQMCGLNISRTGQEQKPHGTPEFPCACYSSVYRDNSIPWHWHEELEVITIVSGSLKLQIPGELFLLKEGDMFAVNSNIMHAAAAEPSCRLSSFVFHPLLITGNDNTVYANKYMGPLIGCSSFSGCMLSSGTENPDVFDAFAAAFEAVSDEYAGYEFTVRENLTKLCLQLYQKYEAEIETGEIELNQDNIRIRKMLAYIHQNYSENLQLSQIAESACIGERECLRCFQRVIQTSPMQYLLKYRVTQGASKLLKNAGSNISEISMQCGFESPSNFSQMFKRYFKCAPREYRKLNESI